MRFKEWLKLIEVGTMAGGGGAASTHTGNIAGFPRMVGGIVRRQKLCPICGKMSNSCPHSKSVLDPEQFN